MLASIGSVQMAPKSIFRLVYRSKLAITGGYDPVMEQVGKVLTWSKSWNFNHGITGALLLDNVGFAQVLEGPAFNVKSLFGHIACDSRHKDIELVYRGFHEAREFSKWSMAFVSRLTEADIEIAATAERQDEPLGKGSDDILEMLRTLLLNPP